MYFSKFEFRRDVKDCDKMHKILTSMFSTDRKSGDLLYRKVKSKGKNIVYTYSNCPAREYLPDNVTLVFQSDISKTIDEVSEVGSKMRINFVTMPYKRCGDVSDEKSYGKKRRIRSAVDRKQWVNNKGEACGFKIVSIPAEKKLNAIKGKHRKGTLLFNPFQYTMDIEVTDKEKFGKLLTEGIGTGRSYGMGLVLFNK